MIKWTNIRHREDLRDQGVSDANEGKDATAFHDLGLPVWVNPNDPIAYHYHAKKADLLRSALALRWFVEFSEGVMGWVPEPSPLVVNTLIDTIEQWLKEPIDA